MSWLIVHDMHRNQKDEGSSVHDLEEDDHHRFDLAASPDLLRNVLGWGNDYHDDNAGFMSWKQPRMQPSSRQEYIPSESTLGLEMVASSVLLENVERKAHYSSSIDGSSIDGSGEYDYSRKKRSAATFRKLLKLSRRKSFKSITKRASTTTVDPILYVREEQSVRHTTTITPIVSLAPNNNLTNENENDVEMMSLETIETLEEDQNSLGSYNNNIPMVDTVPEDLKRKDHYDGMCEIGNGCQILDSDELMEEMDMALRNGDFYKMVKLLSCDNIIDIIDYVNNEDGDSADLFCTEYRPSCQGMFSDGCLADLDLMEKASNPTSNEPRPAYPMSRTR